MAAPNPTPRPRYLPPVRQRRATPITIVEDDPARTWVSHQKTTDDQMVEVLVLLLDHREITQAGLAMLLADALALPIGTARAIVSATLLEFRSLGWVQPVGRVGRSTVWRVADVLDERGAVAPNVLFLPEPEPWS